MRFWRWAATWALGLLLASMLACGGRSDRAAPRASARAPSAPREIEGSGAPAPLPRPPLDAQRYRFALDQVVIRVVDMDLLPALPRLRAGDLLAVNGGFFDGQGEPEGYVVAEGRRRSRYLRRLGGGVLMVQDGVARLLDGETFTPPERRPVFAIQGRPRLVVDGRNNIRRDDGRHAARTALCVRDEGTVLDVWVVGPDVAPLPSLFDLAGAMVDAGCEAGLNLDGGPSTALRAPQGEGETTILPSGPLRHVLVFSSS